MDSLDTSGVIGLSLISAIVFFSILYYVIKAAVSSANSQLINEVKKLNQARQDDLMNEKSR